MIRSLFLALSITTSVYAAGAIDVTRYSLDLIVTDLAQGSIDAEVRIDLRAIERVQTVELHVEPQKIAVDAIRDAAGRSLSYTIVPGTPNAHGLTGSQLQIEMFEPLPAGFSTAIVIEYRITVQPEGDPRGFFYDPDHDGIPVLNTRSWPYYTRYWLPSNDHPSDAASFQFTVRVPAGAVAIANGALVSVTGNTFVWTQDQPIPTYAAQITIGEFASDIEEVCFETKCVPLVFYFPPGIINRAEYETRIGHAADALEYYSGVLGPYEFAKAGFLDAPHPFSMESASAVMLISPGAAVHEIIHHWWGNVVHIETWGDFWISEGLTTYFSGFFEEVRSGANTSCLLTTRKLSVDPDNDPMDHFNADPYCIGAAAIHNYRERLAAMTGNNIRDPEAVDRFLTVFRRVYNEWAFRPVSTQKFTASLARATHNELRAAGSGISRWTIDEAMREWQAQWFTDVPPADPPARRRAARR